MASPVKQHWTSTPNDYGFDALQWAQFSPVASVESAVASTVVQGRLLLPFAAKIAIVAVSLDDVESLDGSHMFNIVAGVGAYETGEVAATATVTVGATPTDADTNTYTIAGHAVVSNQATANSTAQQATADAAAINADSTANLIVSANAIGSVVHITAKEPGPGGNAITLAVASSGGDTLTPSGAALAGGASASGIETAPTDNRLSGPAGGVQSANAGGLGIPTVFGDTGDALFGTDQQFTVSSGVGVAATTGQPALPAPTTTGGIWRFRPDTYDAVWPAGTLLTLRAITPTGGSMTNLVVALGLTPDRVVQSINPQGLYIIPGVNF